MTSEEDELLLPSHSNILLSISEYELSLKQVLRITSSSEIFSWNALPSLRPELTLVVRLSEDAHQDNNFARERFSQDTHRLFLVREDANQVELKYGGQDETDISTIEIARAMYSLDLTRPITSEDEINGAFVRYFIANGIGHQINVIASQEDIYFRNPVTALAVRDGRLVVIEFSRGLFLNRDYLMHVVEILLSEGISNVLFTDPDQTTAYGQHQIVTQSLNAATIPPLTISPDFILEFDDGWIHELLVSVDKERAHAYNQTIYSGTYLSITNSSFTVNFANYVNEVAVQNGSESDMYSFSRPVSEEVLNKLLGYFPREIDNFSDLQFAIYEYQTGRYAFLARNHETGLTSKIATVTEGIIHFVGLPRVEAPELTTTNLFPNSN